MVVVAARSVDPEHLGSQIHHGDHQGGMAAVARVVGGLRGVEEREGGGAKLSTNRVPIHHYTFIKCLYSNERFFTIASALVLQYNELYGR